MQLSKTLLGRLAGAIAVTALAAGLGAGTAAAETIKLGFIGPLSGGNAQQGLGARNGFLLAIEQANEAGYPYEVVGEVLDDASDPSVGVSAALRLVNDPQVVAAIGHWNSPVALATMPVFHRYEMPFIVWGAISPKITEQNLPNVTRVTPTLVNENGPLAEWIATEAGITRVAIVSDTSDYGAANTQWFTEFFTEAGGEIVATDSAPVGTTDFRAILTRIMELNPEALYFGGVITEAGLVRNQMVDLGMDIPMFGISGFYDPTFIEIAGAAADGTIVGTPVVPSNPRLEQLEADYAARNFPEPAGPYAKYAYEATQILLDVIKEHGIEDKAALSRAIREISHEGVLGTVRFDPNGQIELDIDMNLRMVKDGQWQDYEASN